MIVGLAQDPSETAFVGGKPAGGVIDITGQAPPTVAPSIWPWIIVAGLLIAAWWFMKDDPIFRNPDDLGDARDRFEGFHWGIASKGTVKAKVSPKPRKLVKLGELEAVTYRTRKGGRDGGRASWEHHFGEDGGRKPVLALDPDADRLHIVGGDYTVEDRGIVD